MQTRRGKRVAITTLLEINGKNFYRALLAGSSRILENQQYMNKINVFPVPDGDTGTNLASTMRYIVEKTTPHISLKETAAQAAAAALDGARGNSGIIFAQFLYGFSEKISDLPRIDVKQFSRVVNNALSYAIKAIEQPVEGTVITVMRDWALHIDLLTEKIDDFFQLITESLQAAQQSLRETPQKLNILKRYKVVDAGAQGFVYFLEGIIDFIKQRDFKKILRLNSRALEPVKEQHTLAELHFRYCTEALIEGENLDADKIKKRVKHDGDSLVIAGSKDKKRVHYHTNEPAAFFYRLRDFGFLTYQKADDMKRQYETVHRRKWNIGLVTDSVCDLPPPVLDEFQIHMVPVHLHFGRNHYLDKLTVTPDQFYRMLKKTDEFPTTSHPGTADFVNLYSFLASHYDSVIAVHLSKLISGTWHTSLQAAQQVSRETGKKISVINSRHLSGSLGLIVHRVGQAIAAGMGHDEIVEKVEEWIVNASILVSVRTLKYMVKGGRVSPMKGLLANLLNLKPIVAMDPEGKSVLYDKAFSQRGNMKKVLRIIENRLKDKGVRNYSILHAHDPDTASFLAARLKELLGRGADFTVDISPVVGLSAGYGAAAVALLYE